MAAELAACGKWFGSKNSRLFKVFKGVAAELAARWKRRKSVMEEPAPGLSEGNGRKCIPTRKDTAQDHRVQTMQMQSSEVGARVSNQNMIQALNSTIENPFRQEAKAERRRLTRKAPQTRRDVAGSARV